MHYQSLIAKHSRTQRGVRVIWHEVGFGMQVLDQPTRVDSFALRANGNVEDDHAEERGPSVRERPVILRWRHGSRRRGCSRKRKMADLRSISLCCGRWSLWIEVMETSEMDFTYVSKYLDTNSPLDARKPKSKPSSSRSRRWGVRCTNAFLYRKTGVFQIPNTTTLTASLTSCVTFLPLGSF